MRRSFRSVDGRQRWLHADLATGMVPVASMAGRKGNPHEETLFDGMGSLAGESVGWGDARDGVVGDFRDCHVVQLTDRRDA